MASALSVHEEPSLPRTTIALAAALMALAVALRLPWLAAESFWIDEACSAKFIRGGLRRILYMNARDVHPPLYYLGLRAWSEVAGGGDGALRAYSLAWSLAGLALLFGFVRDAGGRRAALFALAVGAVNPLDVHFAREARMYAQGAALGLASTWLLWRWLASRGATRKRIVLWFGYAVAAASLIYTHYVTAILLLAQGLFALGWLLWRRRVADALAYAGAGLIVAISFTPWLRLVLSIRDGLWKSDLGWIPPPEWTDLFVFVGREFFWGHVDALANRGVWPALAVGLAVLAMGARAARTTGGDAGDGGTARPHLGAYLLWLVFGAAALAFLASTIYHPVLCRPRFAVFLAPPFFALAGLACAAPKARLGRVALAFALVAPMIAASWATLRLRDKRDWRAVAEAWTRETDTPSTLALFPPHLAITMNRYLPSPVRFTPRDKVEALLESGKRREIGMILRTTDPMTEPDALRYLAWLLRQGPTSTGRLAADITLTRIRIDPDAQPEWRRRFERWHPVFEDPENVEGFADPACFHDPEVGADGRWLRRTAPQGKLRLADVGAGGTIVLGVEGPPPQAVDGELEFYLTRADPARDVFAGAPALTRPVPPPGPSEIVVEAPPGKGHCWIGWKAPAWVPPAANGSNPPRAWGFAMRWIGVERPPGDADDTQGSADAPRGSMRIRRPER